jgi:hypothetical protein
MIDYQWFIGPKKLVGAAENCPIIVGYQSAGLVAPALRHL